MDKIAISKELEDRYLSQMNSLVEKHKRNTLSSRLRAGPSSLRNQMIDVFGECDKILDSDYRQKFLDAVTRPRIMSYEKVIVFRSNTYGTMRLKSTWEDEFVRLMLAHKIERATYEPFFIKYLDPVTSRYRKYYPDFLINNKFLVEVKPYNLMNGPTVQAKSDAAKEYCSKHNMTYHMLDIADFEKFFIDTFL